MKKSDKEKLENEFDMKIIAEYEESIINNTAEFNTFEEVKEMLGFQNKK